MRRLDSTDPSASGCVFAVRDYDLDATLGSGQSFRWEARQGAWEGMAGPRWVRLRQTGEGIEAWTAGPAGDWRWLAEYLQTDVDLAAVLAAFPDDPPLRQAVAACRGLRLLRQDPWECLASFILSSTKQIAQIRVVVGRLCRRYGQRAPGLAPSEGGHAFPGPGRLAACNEAELRECGMGFRAAYLLGAARAVAEGALDLGGLGRLSVEEARQRLTECRGVGEKIANCALLFGWGFPTAFPVDVWVRRALTDLYFPRRAPPARRLREFALSHFGPQAGYAQQYLFEFMRRRRPETTAPRSPAPGSAAACKSAPGG